MLAALELPLEWLPPAYESTEIAGAGDQAAGALGVGIDAPGPLSVVLGTSGVVFAALDAYRPEPEARLHTFCHAVPGTWHAMGVMLSAAGSLQWLRNALGRPSYDELLAEAAAWPPGTEGLLFQPYLQGERTPHADPDARGAFVGLQLRHDRGALVRAVLEGVAYGLRDSLELLRASASKRRSAGSPAAAHAASSGWRSSRRSSASRSSGPRPRRAPPTARRSSAASRRASSPTRTRPSRRPSASATASSRTPAGRRRTRTATPATGGCIPR